MNFDDKKINTTIINILNINIGSLKIEILNSPLSKILFLILLINNDKERVPGIIPKIVATKNFLKVILKKINKYVHIGNGIKILETVRT